jgi:hypothetical protein
VGSLQASPDVSTIHVGIAKNGGFIARFFANLWGKPQNEMTLVKIPRTKSLSERPNCIATLVCSRWGAPEQLTPAQHLVDVERPAAAHTLASVWGLR